MTFNKNKMIGEIGRRIRLKNRDVQLMLETLIEVWTEKLVSGGRIELENLFVLETQWIDCGDQCGILASGKAPRYIQRVSIRVSKQLKSRLNEGGIQASIN